MVYTGDGEYVYLKMAHILRKHGINILNTYVKQESSHHIFHCENNIEFYCLFKKERLRTFNTLYKDFVEEYPEYCGQAESINCEILYDLANKDKTVFLIFAYGPDRMYILYPKLIYHFCTNHNLKRKLGIKKKRIRHCEPIMIEESVYNIPFQPCLFTNLQKWLEKMLLLKTL